MDVTYASGWVVNIEANKENKSFSKFRNNEKLIFLNYIYHVCWFIWRVIKEIKTV